MRHRLDEILAFLQVIETGSVSAAAERLALSKSVVSKRISDLEAELGATLFQRAGGRVSPTPSALAFSERLCEIMHALDEASEQVARDAEAVVGEVRIAAPMAFGRMHLAPMLLPLLRRHQGLGVALVLDDRIHEHNLVEGVDLAIRMGRPRGDTIVARKLGVSRRVVCCSPDYASRAGLPATIDDLAKHACIGYINVPASLVWQFEPATSRGNLRSVTVKSRLLSNDPTVIRDGAIAGLGLAVLPLFVAAEALSDGRLIDAMPSAHPVPDTIYAVRRQSRHVALKVRAVVDHLAVSLSTGLPWEGAMQRDASNVMPLAQRPHG